ncbi:Phospholipase A2 isozymes PA3A/PA3B/PA5 [Halotydeus destructor]|nr:Phospholipase A2 isozymes PA3A/PA3B/PA5 [Halotydeus destructor]
MRTKQVMADVVLDHKQTAFRVLTGTLWCGRGNRAPDRRHLGSKWQLDSCCRGHDLCSDASPFSVPNGIFQISPCDCDDIFRNCLNQLTSQGDDDATWVKSIYFDILRIPCLPL